MVFRSKAQRVINGRSLFPLGQTFLLRLLARI